MKLLMIYCTEFSYTPRVKTLDDAMTLTDEKIFREVLVAFIQAEEADEVDLGGAETKLVKNLKWAAKKNETKNVLLHSFAHLSESKAGPEFTKTLFDKTEARMKNAEYECDQTAFGYFMDLNVQAPGYSQARIFKSF